MRDRELVIRFTLPRTPRMRWLAGGVAAFILCGAIAYAAVPIIFKSGSALSSADMNQNFKYLDDNATALAAATEFVVTGSLPVSAGAISATATGLAAHMTFTPPVSGSMVVNWSLTVGLNTTSGSNCTVYGNVGLSDKVPTGSDPYVSRFYVPSIVSGQQNLLTGTGVLAVTGGQSTTLYLNAYADCGNYYFRVPSVTARLEPAAQTGKLVQN